MVNLVGEIVGRALPVTQSLAARYAEETIEARMADKRTARLLGIDTRSPVLYQRQHLFAEHGQPVAISTA